MCGGQPQRIPDARVGEGIFQRWKVRKMRTLWFFRRPQLVDNCFVYRKLHSRFALYQGACTPKISSEVRILRTLEFLKAHADWKNHMFALCMKNAIWILSLLCSLTALGQTGKATKYILIKAGSEIPGEIKQSAIDKLDEPLKAIAAFYSAMGGSSCFQDTTDTETCELTTALGLGNQGSEQHKALIKKWFPDDRVANQLLSQDCYLRPSGASTFSDYVYLSLTRHADTVVVSF